MWRWLKNLMAKLIGVEDELNEPNPPYCVAGYRNYTTAITQDASNPEHLIYNAMAEKACTRVMADGSEIEAVRHLTSNGWDTHIQAAHGIVMVIDAALDN